MADTRSMDTRLLDILCCPTSKVPLRPLREDELEAVNRFITRNGDGTTTPRTPLDAGLITRDRQTIYRIDDGIPVMLADAALAVSAIPGFPEQ